MQPKTKVNISSEIYQNFKDMTVHLSRIELKQDREKRKI